MKKKQIEIRNRSVSSVKSASIKKGEPGSPDDDVVDYTQQVRRRPFKKGGEAGYVRVGESEKKGYIVKVVAVGKGKPPRGTGKPKREKAASEKKPTKPKVAGEKSKKAATKKPAKKKARQPKATAKKLTEEEMLAEVTTLAEEFDVPNEARKVNQYDLTPAQLRARGIGARDYQEAGEACMRFLEVKRGKRGANVDLCTRILDQQRDGEKFSDTLKRIRVIS